MLSKIILSIDDMGGVDDVKNWLEFHELPYESDKFWQKDQRRYRLDLAIENSIVVWNHNVFRDFCFQSNTFDELFRFAGKHNQLCVIGTDMALFMIEAGMEKKIKQLDQLISPNCVTFYLDAHPRSFCYLTHLKNIRVETIPYNRWFNDCPRIPAINSDKTDAAYDFLLMTVAKQNRPHRILLCKHLNNRMDLTKQGLIHVKSTPFENWLGNNPPNVINSIDGAWTQPAMDLYRSCYIELLCETCYKDLYYITEKTLKSIKAKTPFLILSTPGYLKHLRNQGFKTFENLIDESYDDIEILDQRVERLLDLLDDIIQNGVKEFYEASKPILEHNFAKLCEIYGAWHTNFDKLMWTSIKQSV